MHLALQSCNLDDGTAFELADSDGDDNLGGALSSDDDEDTDNKRVRNFSVRTGVLDEKAAATQALGLFALHTKGAFQPYPSLSIFWSVGISPVLIFLLVSFLRHHLVLIHYLQLSCFISFKFCDGRSSVIPYSHSHFLL